MRSGLAGKKSNHGEVFLVVASFDKQLARFVCESADAELAAVSHEAQGVCVPLVPATKHQELLGRERSVSDAMVREARTLSARVPASDKNISSVITVCLLSGLWLRLR